MISHGGDDTTTTESLIRTGSRLRTAWEACRVLLLAGRGPEILSVT
jgi:hypothetical protein